ncbi:MAG: hypothetical protein FGM37_09200 [Phycisphaerales bacterium]|nr:hypothetical protein [Phycisphaerales bacterium]
MAFIDSRTPGGRSGIEVKEGDGGGSLLVFTEPSNSRYGRQQFESWKLEVMQMLGASKDRFDLDFPGGTLHDYVVALRAASGFQNIVIDGNAGRLAAPPVSLRGVSLGTVMENLEQTPMRDQAKPTAAIFPMVAPIQAAEPDLNGRARFRVELYRVFEPAPPAPTSKSMIREVNVYRLNAQDGQTVPSADLVRDVRSAIEMACSLAGIPDVTNDTTLQVAFHAPSGLLIVSGTKDVMRIADTVIRTGFNVSKEGFAKPEPAAGGSKAETPAAR